MTQEFGVFLLLLGGGWAVVKVLVLGSNVSLSLCKSLLQSKY